MAQQTYGEWMRSNPPIPNLTAVEWLVEQIKFIDKETYATLFNDGQLEQAKQMEKLMGKDYICNKCKYGKDMQQM